MEVESTINGFADRSLSFRAPRHMEAGHGIAPCPLSYEHSVLLLHSPAKFMAGVDGNAPSNLVLETGRHPYGTPIF